MLVSFKRAGQRLQTYRAGLHDFPQCEVHPCVALDEMAVESFAVLQLYEHRVPLCGIKEAEWQLCGMRN